MEDYCSTKSRSMKRRAHISPMAYLGKRNNEKSRVEFLGEPNLDWGKDVYLIASLKDS